MRSPAPSSPSHRKALWGYGILLGIVCFSAGRLSVRQPDSNRSVASSRSERNAPASDQAQANFSATIGAPQPSSATVPASWNESLWNQTKTQPASPANTTSLAAMLEKLAATDPQHSMGLAQAETNLVRRDTLVQAVLRGWAKSSPIDAAHWAIALPVASEREAGLNSVFSGAVENNPAQAILTGKLLANENPGEAVSYGGHLIDALCEAGHFNAAAEFAGAGDNGTRSFWMGEAYSKWASFQPQAAAQAAVALADSSLRTQALHGVVGGWSMADPASLVEYVTQLPADADKNSMVSQALQRWAKLDPMAASEWINNHDGGAEMDHGIASVATMEAMKPDVAASWAENITSPTLRSETLVSVLRSWATTNLPQAKAYFEKNQDLLQDDRAEIAGVIATLSGNQTASR